MIHNQLLEQDEFLMEICERLLQAQQQYKMYYDCMHHALDFVSQSMGPAEAASLGNGLAGRQG
jgi:hypothetical protein